MSNNVLLPGAQSRFPAWFDAQAQEMGLDPFSAANMYIHWINSPEGIAVYGGNAANLGPYWSQFAPGGALAGQGIDSVDPRFQFGAPEAPPPGPTPDRPVAAPPPPPASNQNPTSGQGSVRQNDPSVGGRGNTPPPRPTAPPAGAPPGNWLLRGNRTQGYEWRWAKQGGGFYEAPAEAAPAAGGGSLIPGAGPAIPNLPPPAAPPPGPVDPWAYNASQMSNRVSTPPGGPGGPQNRGNLPQPSLQPNRRPRPPVARRQGVPGRPRPNPTQVDPQPNTVRPAGNMTYKRNYDL